MRDHFARQADVLGLLGVDAQPGVVLDAVPGGPLRLELGELAEVVAKAVDAAAVEAGPERRLAHGDAAHLGQRLVVVGGPRDHVDVRVDVVHGGQCRRIQRRARLDTRGSIRGPAGDMPGRPRFAA